MIDFWMIDADYLSSFSKIIYRLILRKKYEMGRKP